MVDFDWKTKMVSSDMPNKSPKFSSKLQVAIPPPFKVPGSSPVSCSAPSACSAYELYLRLPELKKLWSSRDFPEWKTEPILKPALQALEITFRLISIVLSDPRPYTNKREWSRRLESLAASQIELVAAICEEEDNDLSSGAPIVGLGSANGVLARDGSLAEIYKIPGGDKTTVVNHPSEESLLPRLATWRRSEDVAEKIFYTIESQMRRCRYTLGVGEPNLAGKPNLEYDAVCRPNDLHNLKKCPYENQIENHENQILYTTHQILESWIYTSHEILKRVVLNIESKKFEAASFYCYLLERIWKLLTEIEDLHLLMDPEDFLRLKNQLRMRSTSKNDAFCFRSKGLVEMTKMSKELREKVPEVLEVEVDPTGGPRMQEAAMRLYREKEEEREFDKVHLLQGMQAVEAALKRFYYAYRNLVAVVMGSVEVNVNANGNVNDSLAQVFLEPTYFPSLDAAKTFLADFWSHEGRDGKRR